MPVIGTAVTGITKATKLAKAGRIIGKTLQVVGKTYTTVQTATTALEMAGDAKLQYAANGGNMTFGIAAKIVGATAMAALSVATAGSLMKDISSLASDINSLSKVSDISLNTSSQRSADVESGKNVDYRKIENGYFDNGERIATKKQVRNK